MRNRRFLRKVLPYQPEQPVHRALVQTDLEEGVRQTGTPGGQMERAVAREEQEQTAQMQDVVNRAVEIEQGDTVDTAEQPVAPVETARAVVEDRSSVQEPRRSGRAKKTNVKYDPDTWDLTRD